MSYSLCKMIFLCGCAGYSINYSVDFSRILKLKYLKKAYLYPLQWRDPLVLLGVCSDEKCKVAPYPLLDKPEMYGQSLVITHWEMQNEACKLQLVWRLTLFVRQ